jgi:Rrf2 family protein
MLFSHSTAYAVRALIWLARKPPDSRWLVMDVANAEGIPQPYLSKVMGTLKSQGFVSSNRGPHGGYTLAKAPSNITLREVVRLFDGDQPECACLLAYGSCADCQRCPIGALWTATASPSAAFWIMSRLKR